MTEIDYLKYKLEDSEKAFSKIHKRYIELLKQQGELERKVDEQQFTINTLKKEIKRLKCMNNQLERRLDYSIVYNMGECE